MKKLIAILVMLGTVLGLTLSTTAPAEATGTKYCAKLGTAIYYDTNFNDGYQWKRLAKDSCRVFDSNDAVKGNGQSLGIIRSLDDVQCYNISPNKAFGPLPQNKSQANIAIYPADYCRYN